MEVLLKREIAIIIINTNTNNKLLLLNEKNEHFIFKKENGLSELVEAPCAPVEHTKLQEWYVLQKRLGS